MPELSRNSGSIACLFLGMFTLVDWAYAAAFIGNGEELTERLGMIYAFPRRERIVVGWLGGFPKRSSTTERVQASYSVLI